MNQSPRESSAGKLNGAGASLLMGGADEASKAIVELSPYMSGR